MSVLELLLQLRLLQIKLSADGDRLHFDAPRGALTPDLRDQITQHKPALLALLRNRRLSPASLPPLKHFPREGKLPLSHSQELLWFRHEMAPHSSLSNTETKVRLEGPLDVETFGRALDEIVRRHEILRTSIGSDGGVPFQVVHPTLWTDLPVTDLRGFQEDARAAAAERLTAEEGARAFELSRGPLLRTSLFRLENELHLLMVTAHHVIFDAHSSELLLTEWATLYSSFKRQNASPLPEPEFQYADFALWQRQVMSSEPLELQRAYWRTKLAGPVSVLRLPTDRPRAKQPSLDGAAVSFSVAEDLSTSFKQLAAREGATVFMAILAVFKALVHRYTGEEDVVIGSPIAGRPHHEMEPMIGVFINTLALRTTVSEDLTFRQLLSRVRETAVGAYAHQDLPFQQVVSLANPHREADQESLFQIMLSMVRNSADRASEGGLRFVELPFQNPVADFELTLYAFDNPEGFSFSAEYQTALFDSSTMQRLLADLKSVIEAVVQRPELTVKELLPGVGERRRKSLELAVANSKGSVADRRSQLTPAQRQALEQRLRGQR